MTIWALPKLGRSRVEDFQNGPFNGESRLAVPRQPRSPGASPPSPRKETSWLRRPSLILTGSMLSAQEGNTSPKDAARRISAPASPRALYVSTDQDEKHERQMSNTTSNGSRGDRRERQISSTSIMSFGSQGSTSSAASSSSLERRQSKQQATHSPERPRTQASFSFASTPAPVLMKQGSAAGDDRIPRSPRKSSASRSSTMCSVLSGCETEASEGCPSQSRSPCPWSNATPRKSIQSFFPDVNTDRDGWFYYFDDESNGGSGIGRMTKEAFACALHKTFPAWDAENLRVAVDELWWDFATDASCHACAAQDLLRPQSGLLDMLVMQMSWNYS
mmetsp:Transcript_158816/g.509123  ORF Transcript_158816/g.509123 Transcript_158816/m.509123 type:complete len:333 (-) Transcript_158816:74-1072(-)